MELDFELTHGFKHASFKGKGIRHWMSERRRYAPLTL
jgi:hypothetical protein